MPLTRALASSIRLAAGQILCNSEFKLLSVYLSCKADNDYVLNLCGDFSLDCPTPLYNEAISRIKSNGGGPYLSLNEAHDNYLLAPPRSDSMRINSLRSLDLVPLHDKDDIIIGLIILQRLDLHKNLRDGTTSVLLCLAEDIAECIKLNDFSGEAVRIQNERIRLLESVVINAKDAILICDAEPIDLPGPRIIYCNDAFLNMTGYSRDEVIGNSPRMLQGADTDPESRAQIRNALQNWKPIEIEVLNYKKDGTPVWVELSIAPAADENGWYTHWISVQRDVTERKTVTATQARLVRENTQAILEISAELRQALQSAEAASVAKSDFLANMSHEIRTPLNGVLGMTEALWLDELTPSQRERVAIIRDSGKSLLAVLNDVLDLAKIEAGKVEVELTNFQIPDLVEGVCGAFTEQANRNGVSFKMTVLPNARGYWKGESTRLRQIIYNLVSNAVKFTSQGQISVTVDRAPDGQFRVQVLDTGIGISSDRVDELFSSFSQGDNSITRRFGGTGLGLSICRQLCELLGGRITVESIISLGSTFTIILPFEYLPDYYTHLEQNVHCGQPADTGSPSLLVNQLRVLVAEDNNANQLVIRALLQAFDVTPVIVENGRFAVEAWETGQYDIILMDIQMPEMDGVTAVKLIRDLEAKYDRPAIPIIAVSANAMTHQVREYLEAGMDDHLAKPLEISKLAHVLSHYASQKPGVPVVAMMPGEAVWTK